MVNVGSLIAYLKLDTSDFKEKANATGGETSKLNSNLGDLAKGIGIVSAGFGVAALAIGKANEAAQKYGGWAQQMKDLSYQTGITTTELQRLENASIVSGTSFSTITIALNRLNISMAAATDKTSEAYKAFKKLGVDPEGKTPKQVFDETSAALLNLNSQTERAALGNAIYGKGYKELLPFIEKYAEKQKEINDMPVLTPAQMDSLDDNKQRWDLLWKSIDHASASTVAYFETLDKEGDKWKKSSGVDPLGWMGGMKDHVQKLLFGGTGAGVTGGAGWTNKQITNADIKPVVELTDKYKGLKTEELLLAEAGVAWRTALDEQNAALKEGNQDVYDIASMKVQKLANDYNDLKNAIDESNRALYTSTLTIDNLPSGMKQEDLQKLYHSGTISGQQYADLATGLFYKDKNPEWNVFAGRTKNMGYNYDATNPASATTVDSGLTSYTPGWFSGTAALAAKMKNMMGDIQSPSARIKLQSYFNAQGGTWKPNAFTGYNPDDQTAQSPLTMNELYSLYNSIKPEYERLTSGPNAKYDLSGNAIIYVTIDGNVLAESVVKKLALLGVKT